MDRGSIFGPPGLTICDTITPIWAWVVQTHNYDDGSTVRAVKPAQNLAVTLANTLFIAFLCTLRPVEW